MDCGDTDLDDEAPAGLEVFGRVAECRNLSLLRGDVRDRVPDEVHESERASDVGGGVITDRRADRVCARLVVELVDHPRGDVDAGHAHAARAQGQRDPTGADRELECGPVASESREEVDGRVEHGRVEHLCRCRVVARRGLLIERDLRHHAHCGSCDRTRGRRFPDPLIEAARQRIGRISRLFERVLVSVAERHDLTVGDWEALSALQRSGPPYQLTPKAMTDILGVTSGTMSVRIERLTRSGLVGPMSSTDLRSRPVRLTDKGREHWSNATADRTVREEELIGGALSTRELGDLNILLAALLHRFEEEFGLAPRRDRLRPRDPAS